MFAHPSFSDLACPRRRVLELFAGIGGVACVWPEAEFAAAVDISQQAAGVYRRNFSHRYLIQEIESLSDETLASFQADFWWLSPPCQPFSRRGQRRDVDDPRTGGLLRIIQAIGQCQPEGVGLENVVGFEGSRAHGLLMEQLTRSGYHIQTRNLCPTEMDWPNRRPRFYLLASHTAPVPWRTLPRYSSRIGELLDQKLTPESQSVQPLMLPSEAVQRYRAAIDRLETGDDPGPTACFAASYGKTLLHAGSYLRCGTGYRRFSPPEVARLLGFSARFNLDGLSHRLAWKLLGNSLSLPAVRYVLSHVPNLP